MEYIGKTGLHNLFETDRNLLHGPGNLPTKIIYTPHNHPDEDDLCSLIVTVIPKTDKNDKATVAFSNESHNRVLGKRCCNRAVGLLKDSENIDANPTSPCHLDTSSTHVEVANEHDG